MSDEIRLYLDDVRICPEGYTLARTAEEAIEILKTGDVVFASLDHDLGYLPGTLIEAPNGTAVTDWMAEHDTWPIDGVVLHSANPIGRATMQATIDRYGPYRRGQR